MKKSFKIQIGYGKDEYIAIEKSELSKAYFTFMTEGKMITNDGYALRGKDIIRIEPNWNSVMGYTRDYKLTGEDYLDIGGKRQRHAQMIMGKAKEIAREVIETGNQKLLQQELNTKFIETGTSEFAKILSDKKKVI